MFGGVFPGCVQQSGASLCQGVDEHHEKCPRNALGASVRNAREMVTLARHEECVVGVVAYGDHQQVRQGLWAGVEEGAGPHSGPGRRGDGLVTGQRAAAFEAGRGVSGAWPGGRAAATEASLTEVLL